MADKIMIAVKIREDVDFGNSDIRQYNDTLYYTQEEYSNLSKGAVDAEKMKRINNWKTHVQNASQTIAIEPTKEEYENTLVTLEEQVQALKDTMEVKGYLTIKEVVK